MGITMFVTCKFYFSVSRRRRLAPFSFSQNFLFKSMPIEREPDAAKLIKTLSSVSNPNRPLMVGVVGIPGSGKSTSCDILAAYLEDDIEALVMPMDGYHYSLEELAKFPNADEAIYRRGASDTFNPAALARDLERIAHGHEDQVRIPGFDHAIGDPVEDQHIFNRNKHRVVICEGLVRLQW
jgi:pantothenate kinase